MVASVRDLQLGDELKCKSLMPTIIPEGVVLKLTEKREDGKGDKFAGHFLGIWIGDFVAVPEGPTAVKWRRSTTKRAKETKA